MDRSVRLENCKELAGPVIPGHDPRQVSLMRTEINNLYASFVSTQIQATISTRIAAMRMAMKNLRSILRSQRLVRGPNPFKGPIRTFIFVSD